MFTKHDLMCLYDFLHVTYRTQFIEVQDCIYCIGLEKKMHVALSLNGKKVKILHLTAILFINFAWTHGYTITFLMSMQTNRGKIFIASKLIQVAGGCNVYLWKTRHHKISSLNPRLTKVGGSNPPYGFPGRSKH